jgi:hypothetical protein
MKYNSRSERAAMSPFELEAERLMQEMGRKAPQYLVDQIQAGIRQNKPEAELQTLHQTLVIVQEKLATR